MSHAPMPWVKLYTSRLDDVRFSRMPDELKWRWTQLTMLAGRLDAGGTFVLDGEQLTDEEIAWHLRIEVDAWQRDSELLKDRGYLIRNGHGWQLTDFMDQQGPDGKHADQRAQWRERQERHRDKKKSVTGDDGVSHAPQSQSQSQSLESESEKNQNQSVITRELLTLSAVPEKHHARLTDISSGLTVDDFLAELARNYARIGSGPGQVKHPPMITALNLERGDRPAANWYADQNLLQFVPPKVLQLARPDLFGEEEKQEVTDPFTGYTNAWIPENKSLPYKLEEIWGWYLKELDKSAGNGKSPERANFDTWIKGSRPIHYAAGKLYIAVENTFTVDWMNEHNFPEQAKQNLVNSFPDLTEVIITVDTEAQ